MERVTLSMLKARIETLENMTGTKYRLDSDLGGYSLFTEQGNNHVSEVRGTKRELSNEIGAMIRGIHMYKQTLAPKLKDFFKDNNIYL